MVPRLTSIKLLLLSCFSLIQGFGNEPSTQKHDYRALNFLDTSLRPPGGISTDSVFDQKCILKPSNKVIFSFVYVIQPNSNSKILDWKISGSYP